MGHRLALVAWVPFLAACTSSGDVSGPAACVAAGGQCTLAGGGPNCAKIGPQDCNPAHNPGGAACCLVINVSIDGAVESDGAIDGATEPNTGAADGSRIGAADGSSP